MNKDMKLQALSDVKLNSDEEEAKRKELSQSHKEIARLGIEAIRQDRYPDWNGKFGKNVLDKNYKDLQKKIAGDDSSDRSKLDLIKLCLNKKCVDSSKFDKNFIGNISDVLTSELIQNETFNNLKDDLFNSFKAKGTGAGEFGIGEVLMGAQKNTAKKRGEDFIGGDFTWEGKRIEMKHCTGSMKCNSSGRTADNCRDEIFKKVLGDNFKEVLGNEFKGKKPKICWHDRNTFTEKFMNLSLDERGRFASSYVRGVYNESSDAYIEKASNIIAEHAGTSDVNEKLGQLIMGEYKEIDGWDILIIFNENKIAIITSPATLEECGLIGELMFNLTGLNRGGDTQALPDGYANVSIRK